MGVYFLQEQLKPHSRGVLLKDRVLRLPFSELISSSTGSHKTKNWYLVWIFFIQRKNILIFRKGKEKEFPLAQHLSHSQKISLRWGKIIFLAHKFFNQDLGSIHNKLPPPWFKRRGWPWGLVNLLTSISLLMVEGVFASRPWARQCVEGLLGL